MIPISPFALLSFQILVYLFATLYKAPQQTTTCNVWTCLLHKENHPIRAKLTSIQQNNLTPPPNRFVADSYQNWPRLDKFRVLKENSSVKLTIKSNLMVAFHFMAFILDEWKVHSYTVIPSLVVSFQTPIDLFATLYNAPQQNFMCNEWTCLLTRENYYIRAYLIIHLT